MTTALVLWACDDKGGGGNGGMGNGGNGGMGNGGNGGPGSGGNGGMGNGGNGGSECHGALDLDPQCATCIETNCCAEAAACAANADCVACINGDDSACGKASASTYYLLACDDASCNGACFNEVYAPACDAPAISTSAGACVTMGGVVECNPVTNEPCQPGDTCDAYGDAAGKGFGCYPGPKEQELCEPCAGTTQKFCQGGMGCPFGQCLRFCCEDADCGTGVCDKFAVFKNKIPNAPVGFCIAGDAGAGGAGGN